MTDLAIVGRYNENLPHPFLGKKFVVMTDRINLNYFRPKYVIEYSLNGNKVTKTGIFKTN